MSVNNVDFGPFNIQNQDIQIIAAVGINVAANLTSENSNSLSSEAYEYEIEKNTVIVEGFESEILATDSSIEQLISDISYQNNIIQDCSYQIAFLQSQLASLTFLNSKDKEIQTQIQALYNAQKSALESRIQNLERKKQAAEAQKTNFETQKNELEQKKQSLQTKKQQVQKEIQSDKQKKDEALKVEQQQEVQQYQKDKKDSNDPKQNIVAQDSSGKVQISQQDVEEQILKELDAQLNSLNAELEAAQSSQGLWDGIQGLFGCGEVKDKEREIEEKKKLLEEAKKDSSKINEAYLKIIGRELDEQELANKAQALLLSEALPPEQKEGVKQVLQEQAELLEKALTESVDGQGWFSKGVGWINNFIGVGTSENEARAKIESFKNLVQDMDPNSAEFASQYKAITGEDFTIESLNSMIEGGENSYKLGNSFGAEAVYDYDATQASITDASIGILSGVITAAIGTLTGGIGFVVSSAIDGTINFGIRATNKMSSKDGYSFEEAGKDMLDTVFSETIGLATGKFGSKLLGKFGSKIADSTLSDTSKILLNSGARILENTVSGFIEGSANSGFDYITSVAIGKEEFSWDSLGERALIGGEFGGLMNLGTSVVKEGLFLSYTKVNAARNEPKFNESNIDKDLSSQTPDNNIDTFNEKPAKFETDENGTLTHYDKFNDDEVFVQTPDNNINTFNGKPAKFEIDENGRLTSVTEIDPETGRSTVFHTIDPESGKAVSLTYYDKFNDDGVCVQTYTTNSNGDLIEVSENYDNGFIKKSIVIDPESGYGYEMNFDKDGKQIINPDVFFNDAIGAKHNFDWANAQLNAAHKAADMIKQGASYEDVLNSIIEDSKKNNSSVSDVFGRYRSKGAFSETPFLEKNDELTSYGKNYGKKFLERINSSAMYEDLGKLTTSDGVSELKIQKYVASTSGIFENDNYLARTYLGFSIDEIDENTGMARGIMMHKSNQDGYIPNDGIVGDLYDDLMATHNILSDNAINQKIGEMRWLLAQGMPWERGSDTIANTFINSIYEALGMTVSPMKSNISLDLQAFCTDLGNYMQDYASYYKVAPHRY